uniref:Uncharacterized protein LOC111114249 n=1 Tax=Crassostrea virginica TaxID=6565 RepID=A0A8B8BZI0_CRAVI|nr:uncharacterized protein LOC111114249 [Crassostrea virginica]
MNAQHLAAIEKQEAVINKALHEIKQVIVHLKSLLETSDVSHVSTYKTRNGDFRKLPPKLKISLPNFQPQRIDTEQLLKQFGSLRSLSIEKEEQGYTMPSPGAESSPPAKPLLDVPCLVTDIPTMGENCSSPSKPNQGNSHRIQTLITLRGWRSSGLCSTSSGDLLVTMICDDYEQTKVVRYSGSTETQTIQ